VRSGVARGGVGGASGAAGMSISADLAVHLCPSPETWRAWRRGELSEQGELELARHLESCPDCEESWGLDFPGGEESGPLVATLAALPDCDDDEAYYLALRRSLLANPPATLSGDLSATLRWLAPTLDRSDARPLSAEELPQRLGNYELLARIGRGSFGSVYRARHVRLEQEVAIKVLDAHRCGGEAAIADFLAEMKAVGGLSHPAIIRATDAGEHVGIHYLVMEYVRGVDLSRALRLLGTPPAPVAFEIARQASWGLDFAHRQGLVHRDVKPANLLVAFSGAVKLLDLGLAYRPRQSPADSQSTRLGTAEYMAPEQWTRSSQVDAQADLYSLGCALFKLLTGELPYREALVRGVSLEDAHCGQEADWQRLADRGVPKAAEALLRRLLEKDPAARPESAGWVARELTELAAGAELGQWLAPLAPSLAPSNVDGSFPAEALLSDGFGACAAGPSPSSVELSGLPTPAARPVFTRRRLLAGAVAGGAASCALGLLRPRSAPSLADAWRPLTALGMDLAFREGAATSGVLRLQEQASGQGGVGSQLLLLGLGRPLRGPFALRVTVLNANAGGGGLFFQWRYDAATGAATFQSIEVRPAESASAPRRLLWSGWKVRSLSTRKDAAHRSTRELLEPSALASDASPQEGRAQRTALAEVDLLGSREAVESLEVAIGRFDFPEVRWKGHLIEKLHWRLASDARQAQIIAGERRRWEFLGSVGVFRTTGDLAFKRPELAYLVSST